MGTNDHRADVDRLKTYPVEEFNKDTDVFPYYVNFRKDGVVVRVPIAMDVNAYKFAQENSPQFLSKLKDELTSEYGGSCEERPSFLSKPANNKSFILISDTNDKQLDAKAYEASPIDQIILFRNEFRKLRCLYGLTYDDVSESIARCYETQVSNHMLFRLEKCALTAWKHSVEVELIQRWITDMKSPKSRAQLFPPSKLKRSLLSKYDTLALKSITFTKAQEAKLEEFYKRNKRPGKDGLHHLKEELGVQVWKIRQWLKWRALRDKE
nr:Homeodomain,homeobox [Hymenolepis microstoma]